MSPISTPSPCAPPVTLGAPLASPCAPPATPHAPPAKPHAPPATPRALLVKPHAPPAKTRAPPARSCAPPAPPQAEEAAVTGLVQAVLSRSLIRPAVCQIEKKPGVGSIFFRCDDIPAAVRYLVGGASNTSRHHFDE